MGNILVLLAFLSVSMFASSSFAQLDVLSEFRLAKAQLNPAHRPHLTETTNGELVVSERYVDLTVRFKAICPQERYCLAVMPSPLTLKLPILKVTKSNCGTLTIAKRDLPMVAGGFEMVEIRDFSGSQNCTMPAEFPVAVRYTTGSHGNAEGAGRVRVASILYFKSKLGGFVN